MRLIYNRRARPWVPLCVLVLLLSGECSSRSTASTSRPVPRAVSPKYTSTPLTHCTCACFGVNAGALSVSAWVIELSDPGQAITMEMLSGPAAAGTLRDRRTSNSKPPGLAGDEVPPDTYAVQGIIDPLSQHNSGVGPARSSMCSMSCKTRSRWLLCTYCLTCLHR